MIQLKNFRCHDEISLSLNGQGLVKIEGKNGSGKSSIFEGLMWVLFGENIKKDSIDSIIKHGQDAAFGRVIFHINDKYYAIDRYRNDPEFNNAVHIVTEEETLEFKNIADANKHIENLINIDKNLFQQTVYLTQYNAYSFADDTDSGKKKFLDSLFDLSIFKDVEQELKAEQKSFDTYIQLHQHGIEILEQKIETCKQRIIDLNSAADSINEQELNEEKQAKEEEVKTIQTTIDTLNEEVKELEKQLETYKEEIPKLTQASHKLEQELKAEASDREIEEKTKLLNDKRCYVCYNIISDEQAKEFRNFIKEQKEIKEHNQEILEYKNKADQECIKLEREQTKATNQFQSKQTQITREKQRLESAQDSLRRWNEYVSRQTSKKEKFEQEKHKQEERLVQLESKRKTEQSFAKESIHDGQILQVILEAFGKDGIRNDFFDKYTTVLQTEANLILQVLFSELGVPVKLELSTYSKKKSGELSRKFNCTFYRGTNEYDYKSFSGGERKRIDIAIVLAMQRVAEMMGRFQSNILIFDEVFDQLDSEGIDTVINYLRNYEKNSIFMISHNDLVQDVDNIVSL